MDNMDWPGAKTAAARLKKALPPNLQDPGDGDQGAMSPQAQQQLQQMQQTVQMQTQQLQQLHEALVQAQQEVKNKQADASAKVTISQAEMQSRERIERMKMDAEYRLEQLRLSSEAAGIKFQGDHKRIAQHLDHVHEASLQAQLATERQKLDDQNANSQNTDEA